MGGGVGKVRILTREDNVEEVFLRCSLALGIVAVAAPSFAADGSGVDGGGLIALGAGLGIGIAALGVGLGQGRATAAAMKAWEKSQLS